MSFTFTPNTNQDGSGNIVIQGTSTTLSNLTVGSYILPNTSGTNGQVLTVINDSVNPKTMGFTNFGVQNGSIMLGSNDKTLNLKAPKGIKIQSGIEFQYDEITAPTNPFILEDKHYFVEITNPAVVSVILPEATSKRGKSFIISKNHPNNIVISADQTGTPDTIDGDTTYTLSNPNERIRLICTGTDKWMLT